MHSLAKDYRLREISDWPIEPLHMHCAVLQIPDGADRAALLAMISADPRIKLAQPLQNFATRSSEYNDPYVELQRGLRQMNVLETHPWSTGSGVKVAIVDTGADIEHPDLRGRIAAADNFVDADAERFRRDRHGTEMAGTIAAVANNHEGIVGIAPAFAFSCSKHAGSCATTPMPPAAIPLPSPEHWLPHWTLTCSTSI